MVKNNYLWRLRASNIQGIVGAWSSLEQFSINGPLPPGEMSLATNVDPETDGSYRVAITWGIEDDAHQYIVEISSDLTFNNIIQTISTSDSSTSYTASMGEYYWRIAALDADAIQGDWSTTSKIEAGVYRQEFGGSGHDYARKIIKSSKEGYIILAHTSSIEITEENRLDNVDWILRLDDEGNITHEYINKSADSAKFGEVYEANDGSIYLIGPQNLWRVNEANIMKLNSNLEMLWEKTYRPDDIKFRYQFSSIVEWDNNMWVTGQRAYPSDGKSQATLHTINTDTGELSAAVEMPLTIDESASFFVRKLLAPTSGNLVITGIIEPEVYNPVNRGSFMLTLDKNLQMVSEWNSIGSYDVDEVNTAVELSNSSIAIFGSSMGSVTVSGINIEGIKIRNYYNPLTDDSDFSIFDSVTPNGNGGFFSFVYNSKSYLAEVLEFNEDLIELNRQHIMDVSDDVRPADIIQNTDGSQTLLYNVYQDNNFNFVVRRIAPIL